MQAQPLRIVTKYRIQTTGSGLEAEAGGLPQVQGQPELHSKTLTHRAALPLRPPLRSYNCLSRALCSYSCRYSYSPWLFPAEEPCACFSLPSPDPQAGKINIPSHRPRHIRRWGAFLNSGFRRERDEDSRVHEGAVVQAGWETKVSARLPARPP